jgi:hypothetical protein
LFKNEKNIYNLLTKNENIFKIKIQWRNKMIENDFIKVLGLNKNILCQFIEKMTDIEINNKIKKYWTIYEHIEHLTFSQNILLGRIKQFLEEDHPKIKPFGAGNRTFDGKYSVKELLQKYCELRDVQIKLIKNATKDTWKKEGIHEEYKKYTFEILVRHSILHDSFHMWRIEELWIENS